MSIEEISKNNLIDLAALMVTLWPESSYEQEVADAEKILNKNIYFKL